MKKILYILLFAGLASLNACLDDLDQTPHAESPSEEVYAQAENYRAVLGKLYTAFVTTGQERGGGNADLSSNNGQDYMRSYFNLQEAGTDEVASTWLEGDKVRDLTYLSWDANDTWVSDMYYRIFYNISICNEFLRMRATIRFPASLTASKPKYATTAPKPALYVPLPIIMLSICFAIYLL